MPSKRQKRPKNRYSKSAKYSEFKTLQLVECFALDFPIDQAARATRMSERTVRDRYAEIRVKLLPWCLKEPGLFNGFGSLLLDVDGNLELEVLEALFLYSESPEFTARMARRYPKFRNEKHPVLHHVIELAIRRFTSAEPPKANADILESVRRIFSVSRSEAYLTHTGQSVSVMKLRKRYWKTVLRRLREENTYGFRRFPQAVGEQLYRDLRYMLRHDPL